MMTLANYGIGSRQQKDPNSAKVLSKSLQIRNRAEVLLKQQLKSHYRVNNDKQTEILNAINDYYSRIPFDLVIWNKYQTKQCIIESILLMDTKFNPYKAREAFRLIEKMLVNLVYLPWHHEFRKILTYSGQYRSLISDPLIGIEEVLKSAGFVESQDCSMHLVLPESKMPQVDDGESVTSVIFDCMIAQTVLSNIIDIYESSCSKNSNSKQAGQSAGEGYTIEVNSNCWIQEYFRERSQHTTERSCANIQEIINSISKLDNTKSKPAAHNERNVQQLSLSGDRDPNNWQNGSNPKLSERTREFLSRQPHNDLLTLPNDLLRLPSTEAVGKRVVASSNNRYRSDLESTRPRPNARPIYGDTFQQQQSQHMNGYNTHQYHQQALYDCKPTKTKESCETVDYHRGGINRNSTDSLISQPLEIGEPINSDREPLLPRYDRRVPTINNLFAEPPSHTQLTSSNHLNRGAPISNNKYNSSSYRKYDSRDSVNKLTNSSRSSWSCSSCTYSNQANSEICEMCHDRRPSR